jgi:tetratricopeptide (TPR) repeat protein
MNRAASMIRRRTALAIAIALLLLTRPTIAQAPPRIEWSSKDIAGNTASIPAGRVCVVLFVRAEQEQSDAAIKQAREVIAKSDPQPQVILIVSGPTADQQAQQLRDHAPTGWPIVTDPDFSASGKMDVHVWPTTVVVKRDGTQAAHLPGLPPQYPTEMAAYVEFAGGNISQETLKQRLAAHEVVEESSDSIDRKLQMASRMLELGNREMAKSLLADVPKSAAKSADEKLSLARLDAMLERSADAIELLDQLPPEDASSSRAKTVRARSLIALGRWNEANPILTELVKQTPISAEAHYLMGLCFQHDQEWAHAAEQFRLAFERSAAPPTSRGAGE